MAGHKHYENTTRRSFLKTAAACIGIIACPAWATSLVSTNERKLSLYNTHTSEHFSAPYWQDGQYLPESAAEFNRLLRDHRTNEIAPIDNRLFDLLHALQSRMDSKQPFHIISGFRSPASNGMLVATTSGVAKGSLHMTGQAVDLYLPDRELRDLHDAAISLQGGGVGYYPASNFVHLDIGRVRSW